MNCRFCNTQLSHEFIDLINSPLSNAFLSRDELNEPEIFYPLKLYVCNKCFLVQIDEYKKSNEIFNNNYAYFSSYSSSWLDHAKQYVEMAKKRFALSAQSLVVEIASNDGYLLQFFKENKIPCLGVEPSGNVAEIAIKKGIETIVQYFNSDLAGKLAKDKGKADLLLGNNVLAHVPDVNNFVSGLKLLLNDHGVVTMEFPHLMRLVERNQFDTIYHEHFSYFSCFTVSMIFESHGLTIFDVEEIPTHGGSLRIYAKHKGDNTKKISSSVSELIGREEDFGMKSIEYYGEFQEKVDNVKCQLLSFFIEKKKRGEKVGAYGAAAKGNTLLNYCGIGRDLLPYVVDLSKHKQGMYLPGAHIPIKSPDFIKEMKPNYLLILPWNIKDEIIQQHSYIRDWGGKFVVPIPEVSIMTD